MRLCAICSHKVQLLVDKVANNCHLGDEGSPVLVENVNARPQPFVVPSRCALAKHLVAIGAVLISNDVLDNLLDILDLAGLAGEQRCQDVGIVEAICQILRIV